MKKYKGELENFPQEVVEKMLEYQYEQNNIKDISVFEDCKSACINGFLWSDTSEGEDFWRQVIGDKRFHVFFNLYPKKEYPKLMLVADALLDKKLRRVIFMKKNGKYLAWTGATTFEEAEKAMDLYPWNYAWDLEEESEPILPEYTMEELTKKLENFKLIK